MKIFTKKFILYNKFKCNKKIKFIFNILKI